MFLTNQLIRMRLRSNNSRFHKDIMFVKVAVVLTSARVLQFILSGIAKSKRSESLFALLPESLQNKFT
ncbi:unnamed protein product, partial [Allacma fusca]